MAEQLRAIPIAILSCEILGGDCWCGVFFSALRMESGKSWRLQNWSSVRSDGPVMDPLWGDLVLRNTDSTDVVT